MAALATGIITLVSLATGVTAEAAPAAIVSPPSTFTGVHPTRFLDTVRGVGAPIGQVGPRTTVTASAAALTPAGTTALVVNLWAEGPTADGAVTVFPRGHARPAVPSLLLQANKRRSNQVIVQVGADRTVAFYNASGSTHLIASIVGYYSTGSGSLYTPLNASRLPIDSLGPGTTAKLNLTGFVPATATAVTFNVTLTQPTVPTYVTAYPYNNSRPTMANVAANPGDQGSNLITVKIGADRSVSLYNLAGTVQVNAVLLGFYATDYGARFTPVAPVRVLDTRTGLGTENGQPRKLGPNSDLSYRTQPAIPSNALAVALNLTGYSASANTSITVWNARESGEPDPSVTLSAGQTVSVATVPTLDSIGTAPGDGEVIRTTYVHNRNGSLDVTADLSGYFTLPPADCQAGCVSAWGSFSWRQGTTSAGTPRLVSGLKDVVAVTGDAENGYALRADGTVRAWGANSAGQLGNGWRAGSATGMSAAPVPVVGLGSVTAIASGYSAGYALRSDGTVWQWGDGVDAPVRVPGLDSVTAIAAAWLTGYALKSDGTVWAWGDNANGELGDGSTVSRSDTPVRVSGLSGVTSIGGSDGWSGYAIKADGTLWGWGENSKGQLGDGVACTARCVSRTPVQASGLTGVTAVAGTWETAVALREDGTVFAWGDNHGGRLGNGLDCEFGAGTGPDCSSSVPVPVREITDAKAIGTTGYGGYAVRGDGTVWGWGYNAGFELGDSVVTWPYYTTVPVRIPGLSGIKGVGDTLAFG